MRKAVKEAQRLVIPKSPRGRKPIRQAS
jgi:hypothetical protein